MNHIIKSFTLLCLLMAVASLGSNAQQKELTLEDIYQKGEYTSKGISAIRWSEDGKSFYTLDKNESGGRDIVLNDIKSGRKTISIPASALIPEGWDRPLEVQDFIWSNDHSKLLIYTNSKRVWRYNTRGDYWVYEPATGRLSQLGKGFEPSRLMFAKFSPDGKMAAYVYRNNIYCETLADNSIKQLTYDGSDIIINGNFDWVYEEELHITDGFRWSNDSRYISYWQFDTEGTGTFYMINNVDSLYSSIIPLPYPKAGTTNSAARIGVVEVSAGTAETRWVDIPGDPRNNYIARMDCVPGCNTMMIQQLNRLQNTNNVYYVDAETLTVNHFMTDTDEAFLDIHDNIIWTDGEKYFTWTSEKDGWRHLYKVSMDGKEESLITKGEFDVVKIVRIDLKSGYVYYIASPVNPTERYLYRSRIDGKGNAERITPEGENGQHDYNIAPNAKYAIHTFSNSETPTRYELISLPAHKTVRVLEDNAELAAKFAELNLPAKEFFRVKAGEVELDTWMIRPSDFDESKTYPVIFYIYGEPANATVQNKWNNGELWSRFLAEQGYIVMSVDPRGTASPRGREWRKSVYGKVGIIPPADHAAAVQEICKMFSFIDSSRIGIWGWSGGGSSTAHLMFKYPDIYATGIAVAGVYSQYLYDTIYQERYMGLPSTNPEGFYGGSPINFVEGLKGNLMIIHGTGDDNVHYQSCEMLVNELVRQGKMFSMLSYPMRAHGINERENTSYHLYKSMLKYWLENLPVNK